MAGSNLYDGQVASGAKLDAKLERWFKVSPAMVHSIDRAGRLIAVSDVWLAKLGYERDEVLGKLSSDFMTSESRQYAIQNVLPEFFRRGRCDNVEYQLVCKDGRVIDVLVSEVLDHHIAENGAASLAFSTDITALKAAQRQSVDSEMRYRGLVEAQSEMVSLAAPEGKLLFVNHAYAKHYDRLPHEIIGKNLFDFIPVESRAIVAEHLRQVCDSHNSIESENQIVLPSGKTRWIAWTNRALFGAAGRVTAIHSVGRDVDRRVAAEQLLKESEARYRLLADYATDIVIRLDADLVRRYVSPACREILGYEPEELLGVTPGSTTHPEDAAHVMQALQSLLTGDTERQSIVNRLRHRDGRWIWVEALVRTIKDPQTGTPTGIIGALRDISARKAVEDQLAQAHRRLEAAALQDGLTGLANRRGFDDAVAREVKRARRDGTPLSLIMIDVDWFKAFNDRYGHPTGDECLRRISGAIRSAAQRPGDLPTRYGGEEFAVLLPDTDEDGAVTIAERVRMTVIDLAVAHHIGVDGVVTVSIGVASIVRSADADSAKLLMHDADRALYFAKDSGRNIVVRASQLAPTPVATALTAA
jgi:diguanylate cyclase (GGDEF)-like protein/PAS domain S-box-containing protein